MQMSALMNVRGVTCRFCGHNTRMFSPVCGKCHQRKAFAQRLPIMLLPVLVMIIVLVGVAAAGLMLSRGMAH
jgi:hypothetical protein